MHLRYVRLISVAAGLTAFVGAILAVASYIGWPGLGSIGAVLGAAGIAVLGWEYQRTTIQLADEAKNIRDREALLLSDLEGQRQAVDDLADGLDIALFVCDSKGTISYANHRAENLFRHSDSVGRSILSITLSYDLEQLVKRTAETGDPLTREIVFTYPEERTGLASTWRRRNQESVFLSIYDITDLRRLERVRQDFVANVSHELRTPMTVIRAYAETLLDQNPPDRDMLERFLPRMISEVDRLSSITQDLLILSAAESNPVRKQVCDLADVFKGVVAQLTFKADAKQVELRFSSDGPQVIEANTSQMIQVALNLIDNAINYTNHGEVEVSVSSLDGDRVIAKVRDTGMGIPSEHVGRIFERFYRIDKGRSRSTGGTGLGLSIVKHLVEAHGGSVSVDTALHRGSTFTVVLPKGNLATAERTAESGT